jgi:Rha family phage regulatory protein
VERERGNMEELVILKNEQALTDSITVAELFGKRHDSVLRTIDNLVETLHKNVERKLFIPSRRKADDGQFHRMYFMNRDGFSLLVMGFTGKKALEWKLKYIEAFNAMEKIISEKLTAEWIETRRQGQLDRRNETNVIQKLVEYAKGQGSEHANMLYMTYTKLANKMVGITDRETATNAQLNDLSTMERLITKVVIDGMNEGLNYKDIYKNSKERLETVYGWLPKEVGA